MRAWGLESVKESGCEEAVSHQCAAVFRGSSVPSNMSRTKERPHGMIDVMHLLAVRHPGKDDDSTYTLTALHTSGACLPLIHGYVSGAEAPYLGVGVGVTGT